MSSKGGYLYQCSHEEGYPTPLQIHGSHFFSRYNCNTLSPFLSSICSFPWDRVPLCSPRYPQTVHRPSIAAKCWDDSIHLHALPVYIFGIDLLSHHSSFEKHSHFHLPSVKLERPQALGEHPLQHTSWLWESLRTYLSTQSSFSKAFAVRQWSKYFDWWGWRDGPVVRTLAVLTDNPGLTISTHVVTYSCPRGSEVLFEPLYTSGIYMVHKHTCK